MRTAAKFLGFLIVLATLASPALAWTARTRITMTQQALVLMPRSLRTALKAHSQAMLRGLLEPLQEEDKATHRPRTAGGTLEQSIMAASRELRDVLDRPASFDEVAEAFGRLAHFTLDASFPPGATARDDTVDRRYDHFAALCEERLLKFPLVYYDDQDLAGGPGELENYIEGIVARAGENDTVLADAYARAGNPLRATAFDDRSIPFAIASLSYSHSINDLARVWLAVWQEAAGDMSHTPFRKQARSPR